MPTIPVATPANYATLSAIGYAEADSTLSTVSADKPLPVSTVSMPAPAALSGTTTASGVVGPFTPNSDKSIVLALSGSWTGTVKVLRSTDGGAIKLPITAGGVAWGVFSANCCEAVWQETVVGAALYLDLALSSGSLTYRMAQ